MEIFPESTFSTKDLKASPIDKSGTDSEGAVYVADSQRGVLIRFAPNYQDDDEDDCDYSWSTLELGETHRRRCR